jgi:predicted dehydrogenase
VGSQGKVDGFLNRREIHHHRTEDETETTIRLAPYKGEGFAGALGQMRTFIRSIQQNQNPPTDGQAGLRASHVAFSIQRSFDERKRIPLAEMW